MFRPSAEYISFDTSSKLYQETTKSLTAAILNNFHSNSFYDKNDVPVMEKIIGCMDPFLVNEINQLTEENFIFNKAKQLIDCLKNKKLLYTFDIFNEYLMIKMLQHLEHYVVEGSSILKKELYDFVKNEDIPICDNKMRDNFHSKRTERLYDLIISPWKAFNDEESDCMGFLLWDYDCLDFDNNGFLNTIYMYADTPVGINRGYGKKYIAELLFTGGIKSYNISYLLDNNPYSDPDCIDNEDYDAYMLDLENIFETENDETAEQAENRQVLSANELFPMDTGKIHFWLMSLERDKEQLKNRPYRVFMDLAITYQYSMSENTASYIPIDNHFLEAYEAYAPGNKLDEDMLYKYAYENTPKLFPHAMRMAPDAVEMELPVYVLYNSNTNVCYNTTYLLLYNDLLEKIAEDLATDFFIMPSTIGQLTIIPAVLGADFAKFVHMDHNSYLPEKFKLTDNFYKYSREDGTLSFMSYLFL